jgi:uncharacterized protein
MHTDVRVISDTHGLLRPEALDAMRGADLILHAGDVDRPEILDALREIAPVHAVRGNVDKGAWANALPMTEAVEIDGATVFMLHIRDELNLDPAAAGFAAVIFGHSHQPGIERENGVLYLNPGSAGPRRFTLPVTCARLWIENGRAEAELIPLAV